jgi:hypothetical protein
MTPHDLSGLDDDRFFEYLAALDRQPDASVETISQAWGELEIRRARINVRMREECAAAGMTAIQVDQLKRAARQIFGVVKREDEV